MSLNDRIQLLNMGHFTDSDQQIIINEQNIAGKASIKLKVFRRCLALHNADKRKIPFLKNQSVADHIVLEFQNEAVIAIHIFELKKSINSSNWGDMLIQFDGAFQNVLGLLGILGLDLPENVIFYAAYSRDKFLTAPSLHKTPIGEPISEGDRINNKWNQEKIKIAWIRDAPLKKIQWDWEEDGSHLFSLSAMTKAKEE